MIAFDKLVRVLHDSVLSANESLMNENLRLLDTYFESGEESDEFISSLDEAIENADELLRRKKISRDQLESAVKAFKEAKQALRSERPGAAGGLRGNLRAKTVKVQFPEKTSKGITQKTVEVPLITLIPVDMSTISELRFKTNLELQLDKDELLVGFSSKPDKPNDKERLRADQDIQTNTSIEIIITPSTGSDGLKMLIEGYEKVLRSQIPN